MFLSALESPEGPRSGSGAIKASMRQPARQRGGSRSLYFHRRSQTVRLLSKGAAIHAHAGKGEAFRLPQQTGPNRSETEQPMRAPEDRQYPWSAPEVKKAAGVPLSPASLPRLLP